MNRRLLAVGFVCGALVAGAAGAGWLWRGQAEDNAPQPSAAALMDDLMWGRGPIGGPFALIDHTGQPRTDADFRGKLLLIYFGFSYCSDVCPTDLQSIAAAVDELGPQGEAVQPLFITVDPQKDTPEQLRTYVSLFHPRLVGLTGDPGQIRKVARAYKVYYAPSQSGEVALDHTGFVYLVGADGKYIGFFPPGTPADRMVAVIRPKLVARAPERTAVP